MHIFLSYAAEDETVAESIQLALEAQGHELFFADRSLLPGHEFNERIRREVIRSELMVFLASPYSLQDGSYARTELKYARDKWSHPRGVVLPVMLPGTAVDTLPPYLASVTVLEPEGNIAAEVALAVDKLAVDARARRTADEPVRVVSPSAEPTWQPRLVFLKVNPRVLRPYVLYAVVLLGASAASYGLPSLWQRLPPVMQHVSAESLTQATPMLLQTLYASVAGIALLFTIGAGLLNMQIVFSTMKMLFLLAVFSFLCAAVTLISEASVIPHIVLMLLLVAALVRHFMLGSLRYYWRCRSYGDVTFESVLLVAFVAFIMGPLRAVF